MTSPARPSFLGDALTAPGAWGLRIGGTGRWLATHAELAGDSRARRTGLLGRAAMPDGHALVIAPSQGIHTVGMRFAIDVVGVARDGRVVSITPGVRPWRVALSWRAYAIVEAPAGRCAAVGVRVGDALLVQPSPGGGDAVLSPPESRPTRQVQT